MVKIFKYCAFVCGVISCLACDSITSSTRANAFEWHGLHMHKNVTMSVATMERLHALNDSAIILSLRLSRRPRV